MSKFLPAELFCEVFGEYVPRLCVDTAVIGPDDHLIFSRLNGFTPVYKFSGRCCGVALKERDEEPRKGQWGLPGGTVFKGETLEDASKRIIRADLGIEIDVLGEIGSMEFPNERRIMRVGNESREITIDSKSFVLLARARSVALQAKSGKTVGWFCDRPPVEHQYHTPFLIARGLF